MHKAVGVLQILSAFLNIFFLIYEIWSRARLDIIIVPFDTFTDRGHFDFIYFLEFYYPVVMVISAVFLLSGGIAALKRKSWGLVLTGALFSLLTPIVYPLINLLAFAGILCNIGLVIGIVAIILTLLSRKSFRQRHPNLQNP